MNITLQDAEVKQALINYLANDLELPESSEVRVQRITRHQGGLVTAELWVESNG